MTDRPIRTLLVDDHEMVLDAMAAVLSNRPPIEVAGSARTFEDAVALLSSTLVDVIVADLQLGGARGSDLAIHASRLARPVPVVLITGTDSHRALQTALASGCAGFVSKSQGLERLVDAVLAVSRGAAVFPASLMSAMIGNDPTMRVGLSPRELEVLQLLADARAVPEISESLHLSAHTIRNHIKQILAKLGAHSQLEAVVLGARLGIVEIT